MTNKVCEGKPDLNDVTRLGYKFFRMITYRFDLAEALPIAFERL